jgi:hypothetical protein
VYASAVCITAHKCTTDSDDMCVPRSVFLNGVTGLDPDWRIWYDRMRRLRPRRYTFVQRRLSPVMVGWIQTGASGMSIQDDYGQADTPKSKGVSHRRCQAEWRRVHQV